MQTINVLGNDGRELSFLLPLSKLSVGDIRFKAQREHLFPIEAKEIGRIPQVKAVTDDGFGRIFKMLAVKSVHTPKIRDAGLGAHPGTAEENNGTAFRYPLLQNG